MNPGKIEEELDRVYTRLESEIEVYAQLAEEAALLEAGYKLAYSKAVRNAEGPNQEQRNAAALLECKDQYESMVAANAALDVQKQLLTNLRTQADLIRTAAANVRQVS